MPEIVLDALHRQGKTMDSLDVLVPHQAMFELSKRRWKRLGLPEDKVVVTIQDHANTSAASIPLALASAVASGKIQAGQTS